MKKASKILVPLLLGLVILGSIFWYLFVYDRAFTRDMLLSQARFQDMHGNSKLSSWFYDLAYDFSGHDDNVAIELANQYKGDGNFTKAEFTLTHTIASKPTVEAYTALSKTYVEQDKLLDAVQLLENVSDPAIKAQLEAMRPKAPEADQKPGFYSHYMDIRLVSDGETICYTTDGSFPSVRTNLFSEAITLPDGETHLQAIAVNELGLVSPISQISYTITGVIKEVTFTDPIMEEAIRAAISADPDDLILSNSLWDITEFTVPDGVLVLEDLAALPNLQKLTISPQLLGTLSPLTILNKLEELDLTGCRFDPEELKHLAIMPALKTLNISDCGLSTIADLENAVGLYSLNASNNTLRNLDVLATMVTLREINLQHNAVTTLDALKALTQLEKLDISFNAVDELAPLSTCENLTWLDASNNKLKRLAPISGLKKLTFLALEDNQLTSVEALPGLTELTNLSVASNEIDDITCLHTLTKLEIFDFSSNKVTALPEWGDDCALTTIDGSYNQLTTLDPLKKMHSLTHIFMDYNLITNIDALADCYCLVQINVFGNEIKDVEKLRDKDIIVSYDPTYGMKDKDK